jgi:diguanylate cyclase (GGDEF)-like protein
MLGALLAVAREAAGEDGVARILARAGEHRPAAEIQRPDGWSTYEQGLALFVAAADVLGDPDIGQKAGIEVFRQYAGTEVLALLRSIGSPADLLRVYPAISAKQSTVTRSEVVEVGEKYGVISVVTPGYERHPLFCGYTLGALSQFPVLFGMEQANVEELECQTRGDPRCLIRMEWDPASSARIGLEREVAILREQIHALTKRYESLESVGMELASTRDVDSMLETIARQAGVAVRAPRYLLVARLPGETEQRIHHVGFTQDEAELAARDVLHSVDDPDDPSRIVVDIKSSRSHFGRLAVFYPTDYHFLPQERSLLMAYAGHAAAALETAAALAESRDRNTTLSALLGLGMALAEQSSRTGVAQRLADAVPEIVRCGEAHVLLWDEGDAHLARVASSCRRPVILDGTEATALRAECIPERMLTLSTPTFVEQTSESALSSILSLTGLAAGVVVPITARTTLFGVLCVSADAPGPDLDDTRQERLSGVASLAATALDSVALLEEVRHQALHDPVTGLANPRLFEDRVNYSLSIARRNGGRLAMFFLDLDRFKVVNDAHGHKVGDELLQAVAQRLLLTVRDEDTVARIGGDEFGLIVQGATGREAVETAGQRIVSAMQEPFVVHGLTLSIGVSIGITMFPDAFDTYETVVSRADAAMYHAKSEGRGRFYFSCP